MLLLIFADHSKIHTMCLVKLLVHKRDVGIRHVKMRPQSGNISSPASRQTLSLLHIKAARLLPGITILCLPPLDGNQSLRGYYLYSTPSMCGTAESLYITWCTSKPLSWLVKASFNPLLADEILSNTIPNKVQCAYEIAACSKRHYKKRHFRDDTCLSQ